MRFGVVQGRKEMLHKAGRAFTAVTAFVFLTRLCYDVLLMAAILFRACRRGDLHVVQTLQRRYGTATLLELRDARGATCLHHAARGGHIAVLRLLSCCTAPRTLVGATPLHDTAVLGQLVALRWLLQHTTCSLRDTDHEGCTALHLAARQHNNESRQGPGKCFRCVRSTTRVDMAADCLALVFHRAGVWSPKKKKKRRAFLWRRKPARSNTLLPSGGSSLKVQNFRYGRVNVLRWLLWEAEMPALERSSNGALALHYAAARGCLDCVRLLVESSNELSANTQMDNDVTPVYLAAQEGHLEVLKYLVTEAGGSLYVRAKDGMAPVHAASQMGCLACLKWMIQEQGVDPNLRDGDGATPLHFAASRGHVDTVRWLLRHGARLVLDKFGKSPINDAAENQQMECLNILVQHGTTPDYTEVVDGSVRLKTVCSCFKDEPQTRCPDCATRREPFFLHPPSLQPPQQDGLYINPAHSSSDPFFLHNPRDVIYNRVKDLFEPPAVKVEVHSSSSDENLSSSDLSERSADPENDYEEIYQSREDKATVRRRSRDSGSHSRSGSTSSSNSRMVVMTPPEEPSAAELEPVSMLDTILSSYDEDRTQESGVSSGSPSDVSHSEEECEKMKVSHRHSLPHLQHNNNNRALKRVVSEPGPACPPPPPPPPPAEENASPPPSPSHEEEKEEEKPEEEKEEEVVEEPTLKPSEVVQRAATAPSLVDSLVNKQMVLPFIPPRFPSGAADSNSLIKPSEYLRSLGGARLKAPEDKQPAAAAPGPPPPPLPLPTADTEAPVQQPLGSISIQDLNSVQLRRTEKMQAVKTMSAPPARLSTSGEQPFLLQKEDLIAELKMSKDITGIKKMKVERAKVEEQQEKEIFTEITKQLTANSFVEKIPDKDATGNPIPAWKRQMMAKKAAERARKELEEQMLKEAEEKRLQSIPPWKRQLLAKKEENDGRKTTLYTPRVVEDKKSKPLKPEEVLRQQSPSSDETNATTEESNKENKTPAAPTTKEEEVDESAQIIPWRAQLRKTNSKLSLLE